MPPSPEQMRRFPVNRALVGMAVMVVAVIGSALLTWQASNKAVRMSHAQAQVLVASERLEQLIDRRPSAALRVISEDTADATANYKALRSDFRRTIHELGELTILKANGVSLDRIDGLEAQIAHIEELAFSASAQSGNDLGFRQLESNRYKDLISTAIAETNDIQRRSQEKLADSENDLKTVLANDGLVSMLLGLAMVLVAWWFVLAPARRWGFNLEAAQREIEASANVKSNFLATMSHEIRTPLNSIIGFSDLLADDRDLSPAQRRQVSLIQNAGTALLTIVNDILDISKLDADKVEIRTEPFSIHSLIDNTVSIVRDQAERKQLGLSVDHGSDLSDYYIGDEHRIRQILLNLLNNAVKFTDHGTVTLSVGARRGGIGKDHVIFAVTDTGEGIAKENQRNLFQMFTQVDNSMRREFGGSGLGLAISKRLVELMDGSIGMESELGRGSKFWFEIPLQRSPKPDQVLRAGGHHASGRYRVLLAEDLAINQELATIFLQRLGHEVDVVENGFKAVEAARTNNYDAILMDMHMPVMDGLSAAKAIRGLGGPIAAVPIIAMTANVLPEQVRAFRQAGMDGFVPKPIKEAELAAELVRVVGGQPVSPNGTDASLPNDVFDVSAYDKLCKILPPAKLSHFLQGLEARSIWLIENKDGPEELAKGAHKLVSQAGMLGFHQLSQAAMILQQTAESGEGTDSTLSAARTAAERALRTMAKLRNDSNGS